MHLIDTKFISELRKGGRANPGVTAFLQDWHRKTSICRSTPLARSDAGWRVFATVVTTSRPTGLKSGSKRCWRTIRTGFWGSTSTVLKCGAGSCHPIPSTPSTNRLPPLP